MQVIQRQCQQGHRQALLKDVVKNLGNELVHNYFFFAVLADCLNAFAVGAPLLPGLRMRSLLPAAIRSRLAWMLEYSPFFIRLALPAPHACLGPFCWAFSLGYDASHPSTE